MGELYSKQGKNAETEVLLLRLGGGGRTSFQPSNDQIEATIARNRFTTNGYVRCENKTLSNEYERGLTTTKLKRMSECLCPPCTSCRMSLDLAHQVNNMFMQGVVLNMMSWVNLQVLNSIAVNSFEIGLQRFRA